MTHALMHKPVDTEQPLTMAQVEIALHQSLAELEQQTAALEHAEQRAAETEAAYKFAYCSEYEACAHSNVKMNAKLMDARAFLAGHEQFQWMRAAQSELRIVRAKIDSITTRIHVLRTVAANARGQS